MTTEIDWKFYSLPISHGLVQFNSVAIVLHSLFIGLKEIEATRMEALAYHKYVSMYHVFHSVAPYCSASLTQTCITPHHFLFSPQWFTKFSLNFILTFQFHYKQFIQHFHAISFHCHPRLHAHRYKRQHTYSHQHSLVGLVFCFLCWDQHKVCIILDPWTLKSQ